MYLHSGDSRACRPFWLKLPRRVKRCVHGSEAPRSIQALTEPAGDDPADVEVPTDEPGVHSDVDLTLDADDQPA